MGGKRRERLSEWERGGEERWAGYDDERESTEWKRMVISGDATEGE